MFQIDNKRNSACSLNTPQTQANTPKIAHQTKT